MRVAMVVLGLLALNAFVTLAGHYGIVSQTVVDYAVPVLGIPFLVTSVAIIWLSIRALLQFLRSRRTPPSPGTPAAPNVALSARLARVLTGQAACYEPSRQFGAGRRVREGYQ